MSPQKLFILSPKSLSEPWHTKYRAGNFWPSWDLNLCHPAMHATTWPRYKKIGKMTMIPLQDLTLDLLSHNVHCLKGFSSVLSISVWWLISTPIILNVFLRTFIQWVLAGISQQQTATEKRLQNISPTHKKTIWNEGLVYWYCLF